MLPLLVLVAASSDSLAAKIKTQKNSDFLLKSAKTPTKYTLCLDMQIQLTDDEIYSLREEMRAALEGMEKLELDRQASDAFSLAESANGCQRSPQADGFPAASDGQPAGSDTPL